MNPIFNKETYTSILPIESSSVQIPHTLTETADGIGMIQKNEFHMTIIGFKTAKDIQTKEITPHLQKSIEELLQKTDWKIQPENSFFRIQKTYPNGEERESIIQLFKVIGLDDFYKRLNSLLGTKYPVPFPHVTLFAKSTDQENMTMGIGIYSEEEFINLNPIPVVF